MQTLLVLVAVLPLALPQGETAPKSAIRIEALDAAIERGAAWLRARQQPNGAFAPESNRDACTVALTAMAAWGLNEPEPRCIDAQAAESAARFLLSHRREDGGIYDPARGLPVYTSGVAARALRTLGKREDWPELARGLADAELFTYHQGAPESVIDAAPPGDVSAAKSSEAARELLDKTPAADEAKRKALEFLARSRRDSVRLPSRIRSVPGARDTSEIGPFSYDDLLPMVYFDLAPEQQIALRISAALAAYYTHEHNPDLTKRYGAAGFSPGTQGLYYYYYVAAKALTTFHTRELVTADGAKHDWAVELATRLVRLQRDDGAWANSDNAWWESEPVLASSYALLTLKLCRAELAKR